MNVHPAKARPAAADLDLQVGESLQVQFLDDDTRGQFYVKVIGFLPERSLLVTTPEREGRPLHVSEGRAVLARSYSGAEARGFTCTVLRSSLQPYAYLHLSYPQKLENMAERQANRVRSALAVSVRGTADAAEVPAVIRDVSNTGAQLLAGTSVGKAGDRIVIRARFPLDVVGDQGADLPALIRNVQDEQQVKGSLWRYKCGVEFEPLDTQATLVLRAYLYERFAGPR
ncbi:MAG TPA: flagellar brake protein [Verrucomicrobiae bacterium]|nr:flagellar brake protein [Verrucomicrobiae bacterium]